MSSNLAVGEIPAVTAAPRPETPLFRRAAAVSVCGKPECDALILKGQRIVKASAGRSWRHVECEYPRHIGGSGRPQRRASAA
jgi:hypothetical protein